MKRSVLLSMMAENEAALLNRWSAAARAASSGSNWVAANLKRRAAYAQRDAAAQAASASPYAASRAPTSGAPSEDEEDTRYREHAVSVSRARASRSTSPSRLRASGGVSGKPKTSSGWASLARREYKKRHGRYPVTEAEIEQAEDFVEMPSKYRSVIMDKDPVHTGEVSDAGMEAFMRLNKREPVTDSDYLEVQALTRLAKAKKPSTAEGWEVLAQDEFDRKYGRIPETDSEIAEAEEYVGMPEKFRSGGAPVPVQASPVAEASDLPDAWDDYHESGLSGMGEENRKAVFRDILSRRKSGGEADLSGSDRRFLGEYKAAALADYSRNGTAGIDPEHYEFLKETGYFDGPSVKNRSAHYEGLCNRVEAGASELLRNIGWTDEARLASLLARRANASSRPYTPPPLRRPPTPPVTRPSGALPPPGMDRATEGAYVRKDGFLHQMIRGKLVRIGSDKVVSVAPNGDLIARLNNGRTINLSNPFSGDNPGITGGRSSMGLSGFLRPGSGLYQWGNVTIDLNTGDIREAG